VFGAGGGTSSYREVEDTDVVLLWGSNARAAHPIWFHHLLKGIRNGARLYVIDPRRTASAEWADVWLGLHVGSDIALANAMAREIIHAGLTHPGFIANGTTGFDAYRDAVEPYTLEFGERATGIPADAIREAAHTYARADKAMVCWTLGITEHHNAVDNVLALINLSLLTGHVGRWGCGCNPLRGQNNVQGGGDMGAIPNKLPGFQDIVHDTAARDRIGRLWGTTIPPAYGLNLTQMLHAMSRRELTSLYVIGENPAQSDADAHHVEDALAGLDHLVVQEIFLTRTADFAHVVLPAAATWCEGEGTVTNSERRVQRVRKATDPPAGAKDELWRRGAPLRRRHELRPARRAERDSVAVPRRDASGRDVPAQPVVAGAVRRAPRAVQRRAPRPAGRTAGRGVSVAVDHGAPSRVVQHRRADRAL
jgi:predicted molibdopterin-dependent oxidoreductase YjgC